MNQPEITDEVMDEIGDAMGSSDIYLDKDSLGRLLGLSIKHGLVSPPCDISVEADGTPERCGYGNLIIKARWESYGGWDKGFVPWKGQVE